MQAAAPGMGLGSLACFVRWKDLFGQLVHGLSGLGLDGVLDGGNGVLDRVFGPHVSPHTFSGNLHILVAFSARAGPQHKAECGTG